MRFAGSQLTNFLSGTNFDNIGKAGIVSRANENNASVISDSYVDRFNLGPGQAGLDPGVDLDPYLLSSPFSSISA